MKVIKERLKWNILGLLTIPYLFIIICGMISLKTSFMLENSDLVITIFSTLIIILALSTLFHILWYWREKRKGGIDIISKTTNDEIKEEGVNEFANVIGKDTQFIGDIHTNNDVLVLGVVKGNINTTADVYVDGMVEGSIFCRNLAMNEAVVNADIDCYREVFVDTLSIIRGNVHTDVLIHKGKIKGNIDIEGHMELSKECIILGDVYAREMQLPPGAQIHGKLNIKK